MANAWCRWRATRANLTPTSRLQLECVQVVRRTAPVAASKDDQVRIHPRDRMAYQSIGFRTGHCAARVNQILVHGEEVKPMQVVEGTVAAPTAEHIQILLQLNQRVRDTRPRTVAVV